MRNILDEILSELEREETQEKVRVGRISEELQNEFTESKKLAKEESEIIQNKIKAHLDELKSIKKKFTTNKMELWEKVYDELGLNEAERGDDYAISNRIIYRLTQKNSKDSFFQ